MHGLGLVPTVQPLNPTNLLSLLRHRLTATPTVLYFLTSWIVRFRSLILVDAALGLFVSKISTEFRYPSEGTNSWTLVCVEENYWRILDHVCVCVDARNCYHEISKNTQTLVYV